MACAGGCGEVAPGRLRQGLFAQIAEKAASLRPDLVIHLGDYLYRESPCPAGNKGCEGSPWGDSLSVWQADFLTPADELLASAPWLLLRGNHEECTRAGKGWSRLFDPAPFDAAKGCNPPAEPLRVRLGAVDLLDLDNSSVDHKRLEPEQVKSVRAWLDGQGAVGDGRPLWLFMHRPVRGVVAVKDGKLIGGNQTLAEGLSHPPKGLEYYFSGHQHTFQVLNFTDGSPPQIISGHGAASLDGALPASLSGLEVAGKTIAAAYSQTNQFGFVLLERGQGAVGWTMTNHDRSGAATMRCTLKAGVVCEPVPAAKAAGN